MCYHPNIIIQDRDKFNPNTGKNWQMVSYINSRSKNFKGYEFYNNFNLNSNLTCDGKYRAVQVPCQNKCIQCCENKAKEWATKVMLEVQNHKECYFITLTYNDKYIPQKNVMEDTKGNIYYDDGTWNSYLEYEDARRFIRKVRDWQRNKYGINGIKIFGCGEYGGKEGRAHFHIIIMGMHLEPNDVKVHQIDQQGNVLYECQKLEQCWIPARRRKGTAECMGFITVAEVNWQTARYVAGYVQKKNLKNKHDEYEFFTNKEAYYCRRGQTPEKCFMSTHPGIGKSFYEEENMRFFEDGYILINGAKNQIVKAKIPTYYEKLLERENDLMLERHKKRKQEAAMKALEMKMSQTSLSIKEQLEVEERIKKDKMLIFSLRDKVE